MPRFYFNIRDGETFIPDLEGVDMPSPTAALEEAKQAARDLIADRVKHGEVIDGQEFEVSDDLGVQLFTLPFKSVLKLE